MQSHDITSLDLDTYVGEVMGWCERVVPFGRAPEHHREWIAAIIGSIRGHARYMLETPIQHYKTTTTLVTVAWMLSKWPWLNVIVMQYSHDKAQSSGRILREYAKAIGVKMKEGHSTIGEWKTDAGGGCVVMSIDQSRAGFAHDILLVDDPISEQTCELKKDRDKADAQIALYTMRGASHLDNVFIVASP